MGTLADAVTEIIQHDCKFVECEEKFSLGVIEKHEKVGRGRASYLAVVGTMEGLKEGKYKVEVHKGKFCPSSGPIFNPVTKKSKRRRTQGQWWLTSNSRTTTKAAPIVKASIAAGSLGSFKVKNGKGMIMLKSKLLLLRKPSRRNRNRHRPNKNVVGRAVVIRNNSDVIVACGVIEMVAKRDSAWTG